MDIVPYTFETITTFFREILMRDFAKEEMNRFLKNENYFLSEKLWGREEIILP